MRQVPITREQTERLISGTLNGYHGLISLDGLQTQRQAGNGLYEGMTTVTVSNSGRLGSVLEQMAGLTLKTVIPRQEIVVASDVMTGETGDMATSAENLLESYVDQIGRVKHFLDVQEASKIQRVASFKEALSGLDLAYKTGSVKEVSDALERVAETAQWGSKVPVGLVYGAAEEMK